MKSNRSIRVIATALLISIAGLAALPTLAQSSPEKPAVQAAESAAPTNAAAHQPEKETVDNPYGLDALWKGGDFVAKGTLALLVLMSAASWYVIFTKAFEQTKISRQSSRAAKTFAGAASVPQAIDGLDEQSAYRFVATNGLEATKNHGELAEFIDYSDWVDDSIQRSIDNVQGRLQDGLALLATVGATAPFVGLFGTVWGIYHALSAIGIAGQASIDKVAGPVGESLIMTAIGLAVAVPAVLGYNWLVRRNKLSLEKLRNFGATLHTALLRASARSRHDHHHKSGTAPVHALAG